MAKVKIEGNASGTGTFTIAAPNSNTDRTLTLPDAAGELLTTTGDGSGLTGISSYADSDALSLFNASGSAPVYACRAWVNFNGTGTVAIRDSGNVSSITDVNVGNYYVNFATAMPDTNYACVGNTEETGSNYNFYYHPSSGFSSASYAYVKIVKPGTGVQDNSFICVAIFR